MEKFHGDISNFFNRNIVKRWDYYKMHKILILNLGVVDNNVKSQFDLHL